MKKLIAIFVVLAMALTVMVPFVFAEEPDECSCDPLSGCLYVDILGACVEGGCNDDTCVCHKYPPYEGEGTETFDGIGVVEIVPEYPDEDPFLVPLGDDDTLDWWLEWASKEGDYPGFRYLPYAGEYLWFSIHRVPMVRVGGVLVSEKLSALSFTYPDPATVRETPLPTDITWLESNGALFSIFVFNPTSDRVEMEEQKMVTKWIIEVDDLTGERTAVPYEEMVLVPKKAAVTTWVCPDPDECDEDGEEDCPDGAFETVYEGTVPLEDVWYDVSVSVGDFEIAGQTAIDNFTLRLFDDYETLGDNGGGFGVVPFLLDPLDQDSSWLTNDDFAFANPLAAGAFEVVLEPNEDPELFWSFDATKGLASGNLWFSNSRGELNVPRGGIKLAGVSTAVITVDLTPAD